MIRLFHYLGVVNLEEDCETEEGQDTGQDLLRVDKDGVG